MTDRTKNARPIFTAEQRVEKEVNQQVMGISGTGCIAVTR